MTGFHRLSILAIAAVLAAGCGATPPTTGPSASIAAATETGAVATAAPRPTASAAPSKAWPTLAPLPTYPVGCEGIEAIDLPNLDAEASASIGHFGWDLQVTRVEELYGSHAVANPPPRRLYNDDVGQMLGGREFLTRPSSESGVPYEPPIHVESATATLALDNAGPMALPTRHVPGNDFFDQVAIAVPDVSGPATVLIEFTWTEGCYRFDASASRRVDVVPLAMTAGCEMEDDALDDQLRALLEDALLVNSTSPAFVASPYHAGTYVPHENIGTDAFIQYGFKPKDPAIVVSPGGLVRIENQKPRLDLADTLKLVAWTRGSLAQAVKQYPPGEAVEVLDRRLERQPDGSFQFHAPEAPGRYVAALSVKYELKCVTGTLWVVVNIDVE